jgi:general nucleoside transport system permease protein
VNGLEETLIGGVSGGIVILFPALGELVNERAGVVNLGTEGCMLAGALGAFAVAVETGNSWVGVLAGVACGAIASMLHAWLAVRRKADQLASGLLLWFLVLGITSVFGTDYVGPAVDPLQNVPIPGLSKIPWIGSILFDHDILVYVGYVLVAVIWFVFYRTQIGLRLRATGERPDVVATAGGRPQLVQILAVVIGGALGGLGGAQLSVGYVGNWTNNMTSGYGFVAVSVVLFASWRPVRVMLGAYLFGLALAAASVLQAHNVAINQYLLAALPYLVTLVALAAFARRSSADAPEELGRALNRAG